MNYFISALKKYAVFTGRARRAEFWYFFLFLMIIVFVMSFIGGMIGFPLLGNLAYLALLLPYLAVAVRRVHDVNKSGWFILIPIYNLVLFCTEGTTGPNQYGSDPKRPEFDEFLETPATTPESN